MHYFEFGKRDATIYSSTVTSSINTGFDEVLEINKVVAQNGTVQNISRVLIDFDYSKYHNQYKTEIYLLPQNFI